MNNPTKTIALSALKSFAIKETKGAAIRGIFILAATGTIIPLIKSSIVITKPDEVKLILFAGAPVRHAPEGWTLKVPFLQEVFGLTTSLQEFALPKSSVAVQDGIATARDIESSIFIRVNGDRERRNQTLSEIRESVPDFKDRLISLAETALRDTVRVSSLRNVNNSAAPTSNNFLDTELIGTIITQKLQLELNNIVGETKDGLIKVEVVKTRVGNFIFDEAYLQRREIVAAAQAQSEAASYKAREEENISQAVIKKAEGQAKTIELEAKAVADGIALKIKAAGSAESLANLTLAENWNGQRARINGVNSIIVDDRTPSGEASLAFIP